MTILKLKSISFPGVSRLSQFRINKDFLIFLLILIFLCLYVWIGLKYFIVVIIVFGLCIANLIWALLGCPRPFIKNKKKV